MGTTLTGTTPQDTYDSLIKVTDNGPLSGTAKYLSDGLGNDSALAVSTTAVGIGTTTLTDKLNVGGSIGISSATFFRYDGDTGLIGSATSIAGGGTTQLGIRAANDILFATNGANERMRISATGNVGIGTSSPTAGYKLDLRGRAITYNSGYLADFVSTESNASAIQLYADNTNVSIVQGGTSAVPLTFFVGGTEKMRVQAGGGISFNGDTAAANALDDYEEGTWSPVINGSSGNPTVTYATGNTGGIYTKVGNKVSVSFEVRFNALSGGSGAVTIAGLPFTRRNTNQPDGDHVVIQTYGVTISGKYVTGVLGSNTSTVAIQLTNSASATTDLTIADLPTATLGFIRGSVTYFV